jgi:hypothetical protein
MDSSSCRGPAPTIQEERDVHTLSLDPRVSRVNQVALPARARSEVERHQQGLLKGELIDDD